MSFFLLKVLEKHQKGVMSVSWCPRDPDLLLSCGKDNHVFCWNPNTSPPEVSGSKILPILVLLLALGSYN